MSILDPFVDVVEKAADVVTSVIDRTPGFSELKKKITENPVIGSIVMTAVGSALFSSLSAVALPSVSGMQTVGPQIASVAFAVPGMVLKDQDFITAYVGDVAARTVATAAYFATGPGAVALSAKISAATNTAISAITGSALQSAAYEEAQRLIVEPLRQLVENSGFKDEIDRALRSALAKFGGKLKDLAGRTGREALRQAGVTAEGIARKYGVRPDVAALGINAIAGVNIYSAGDPAYADYDVLGNPKPGTTDRPGAPLPNVELAILQEALRTLGYTRGGQLGVGSENDPGIVAGIRSFQTKAGLPVTGKADAKTRQLLQTAMRLPRVAAEVRAAPKPTLSRELQAVRAGTASAPQPFLSQLVTFAVLTSPVWFTFLVLPRLRKRARSRTTRAVRRRR